MCARARRAPNLTVHPNFWEEAADRGARPGDGGAGTSRNFLPPEHVPLMSAPKPRSLEVGDVNVCPALGNDQPYPLDGAI